MRVNDCANREIREFPAILPTSLGSAGFRAAYGIKYAYLVGAMYKGISSKEMVVALGKAGMLGFLGTGGMRLERIQDDIRYIQDHLPPGARYGMNLINSVDDPELERRIVDLYLKSGIRHVEAAAYMQVNLNLVRYRLKGATRSADGTPILPNHVMAKVSRAEVAAAFMAPPPEAMVRQLVASGELNQTEAEIAADISVAGEICVEADSAGHTDRGVAYALMPVMLRLREDMMKQYGYRIPIYIGAAGGIGTPEAAAAALMMGADFILTGSINQCTVESGISAKVKGMLQRANIRDTAYAPAGDMFEFGAKVQVLRKGLLFAARANRLYELYSRHNSIDELDHETSEHIQSRYFKRRFEEVWDETRAYYTKNGKRLPEALEKDPKQKMALIFKWYFVHSTRLACSGSEDQVTDYQVHCGPAMGAFNQWVKGTEFEPWQNRRVVEIGEKIMQSTADLFNMRFQRLMQSAAAPEVSK